MNFLLLFQLFIFMIKSTSANTPPEVYSNITDNLPLQVELPASNIHSLQMIDPYGKSTSVKTSEQKLLLVKNQKDKTNSQYRLFLLIKPPSSEKKIEFKLTKKHLNLVNQYFSKKNPEWEIFPIQNFIQSHPVQIEKQKSNFIIQLVFDRPPTILDSTCKELGIEVDQTQSIDIGQTQLFYAWINCKKAPKVDDYLQHVNIKFSGINTQGKLIAPIHRGFEISNSISQKNGVEGQKYTVSIYSNTIIPKIRWYAGVGLSYLSYSETLGNLKLNELAITPKASAIYWINPGKLNLHVASNFSTPIQSGSANQFSNYGVNIRTQYFLPKIYQSYRVSLAGGAYAWGMLVNENAYGASYLIGPQAFLSFTSSSTTWIEDFFETRLSHQLYFKWASISENIGLSFKDAEYAFGLQVEVSDDETRYPLVFGYDLSRTSFYSNSQLNGMELWSQAISLSTTF